MFKGIIVGLGGRAKSWLRACHESADVELIGYVDPVEAQREQAISDFSVDPGSVFANLEDAIDAGGADFVLDVTPPVVHERIATTAFAAGLHVIEEKPLSDDFAAAQRMVTAAAQANRTYMITQNYRFGELPRTMHRLLKEGRIGNPEMLSLDFFATWAHKPGTHYTTMPFPLLTDMGIHHFDLLRYVTDREPVRVTTQSWNPTWGWHAGDAGHSAVIEFTGGLIVAYQALGSSVGRRTGSFGSWRFDGPQGSLSWQNDRGLWIERTFPTDKTVQEEIPIESPNPAQPAVVLQEFASALNEGREPECSGQDNIRSLALCLAAVQSARAKRTVEIAEFLEGGGLAATV